jgi:hypothetical protein
MRTTESLPVIAASHNIVAENARGKLAFCRVTHVFAVRDQSARLRTAGKKRIVQNGLPAPPSLPEKCFAALQYVFTSRRMRPMLWRTVKRDKGTTPCGICIA